MLQHVGQVVLHHNKAMILSNGYITSVGIPALSTASIAFNPEHAITKN